MKKAIISSILAIGTVGAITASAVFLPAVVATNGYSLYTFNYAEALNNKDTFNLQTSYLNGINVGVKEAILGTTKINNGNYFIYIGSEGYASHRTFLYDQNSIETFGQDPTRPLDTSNFGNGIQCLNSDMFTSSTTATTPVVLSYIDMLTMNDFSAREEYENTIAKFKNLQIVNSADKEQLSEKQLKINKKKYDWANAASAFDFTPGATYKDWEGKTKYYRSSYESGLQFNEIVSFVKKNFTKVKDITTSDGIIIGYKKGKLVTTQYSGSFDTSSSSSSASIATNSSAFLASFTPTTSFRSTFALWLQDIYLNS